MAMVVVIVTENEKLVGSYTDMVSGKTERKTWIFLWNMVELLHFSNKQSIDTCTI